MYYKLWVVVIIIIIIIVIIIMIMIHLITIQIAGMYYLRTVEIFFVINLHK